MWPTLEQEKEKRSSCHNLRSWRLPSTWRSRNILVNSQTILKFTPLIFVIIAIEQSEQRLLIPAIHIALNSLILNITIQIPINVLFANSMLLLIWEGKWNWRKVDVDRKLMEMQQGQLSMWQLHLFQSQLKLLVKFWIRNQMPENALTVISIKFQKQGVD